MNERSVAQTDGPTPEHEVGRHPETIRVLVNHKPIELSKRRVTGLEIKEAAIAQGVRVELDFVLFLERGPGKRQVVGDEDVVHVKPGMRFEAIPHDDNS